MATKTQQQRQGNANTNANANKPIQKRKPVFVKVDYLKPGTNGHTLIAEVLSSNPICQKGRPGSLQTRQAKVSECLVGDDTGIIIFTARNEQVDLMTPGVTVILCAKIDMFKGSMRLAVDKWGRMRPLSQLTFWLKMITICPLLNMNWSIWLKNEQNPSSSHTLKYKSLLMCFVFPFLRHL